MNLYSPTAVRELLRRHDVRPSRRWGQNFLIDRNALERVVAAAEVGPEDGVLEIGPGLGVLTRALAERCRKVLAVEVDPRLAAALAGPEGTLAGLSNVELVQADFLQLDLPALLETHLGPGRHRAVANIPYSITSPVIVRLLEHAERLELAVLMVQKEVAARLAAAPGSGDYGSLTLFAQFYADVARVATVPRSCFFPAPEVDSAIVRLRTLPRPRVTDVPPERFFGVVRAAFQQRRKRLLNSLSGSPALGWSREQAAAALAAAAISPDERGENLSLDDFARLARAGPPPPG